MTVQVTVLKDTPSIESKSYAQDVAIYRGNKQLVSRLRPKFWRSTESIPSLSNWQTDSSIRRHAVQSDSGAVRNRPDPAQEHVRHFCWIASFFLPLCPRAGLPANEGRAGEAVRMLPPKKRAVSRLLPCLQRGCSTWSARGAVNFYVQLGSNRGFFVCSRPYRTEM